MWLDGREQALEHVGDEFLEMLWRRGIAERFPRRLARQEIVHDEQRGDVEVVCADAARVPHGLLHIFTKRVLVDAEVQRGAVGHAREAQVCIFGLGARE